MGTALQAKIRNEVFSFSAEKGGGENYDKAHYFPDRRPRRRKIIKMAEAGGKRRNFAPKRGEREKSGQEQKVGNSTDSSCSKQESSTKALSFQQSSR